MTFRTECRPFWTHCHQQVVTRRWFAQQIVPLRPAAACRPAMGRTTQDGRPVCLCPFPCCFVPQRPPAAFRPLEALGGPSGTWSGLGNLEQRRLQDVIASGPICKSAHTGELKGKRHLSRQRLSKAARQTPNGTCINLLWYALRQAQQHNSMSEYIFSRMTENAAQHNRELQRPSAINCDTLQGHAHRTNCPTKFVQHDSGTGHCTSGKRTVRKMACAQAQ